MHRLCLTLPNLLRYNYHFHIFFLVSFTVDRYNLKVCLSYYWHAKEIMIHRDLQLKLINFSLIAIIYIYGAIYLTLYNFDAFYLFFRSDMISCAGCQLPICDKFLLSVLDRKWHTKCVQCSECKVQLSDKCFSRDGKLYCRNDFFR